MISLTLGRIAEVVGGQVVDGSADIEVTGPAFRDSRSIEPGGLFVALQGERVDGHDYAARTVAAGAAGALVSRRVGVPAVQVSDVVAALALLASYVVRTLPNLVVIGLTGSQGKTTTKDLLAHVLEQFGETVAPEGSLNNEIGLPLTILRATTSTRYLVLEMGARGRGHITFLASLAPLSAGVVLNVGVAHLGEFGSRDAIAAAKGELVEALPAEGLAVLNADDSRVLRMRERTAATVVTFGQSETADVRVQHVELDELGRVGFDVEVGGSHDHVQLGLVGEHHAGNAAAVVATATGLGLSPADVVAAISGAGPRSRWRMQADTTEAGVTVVNDAYNANPDSMRAALETLAAIGHRRGPGSRTVAVLGEMLELGPDGVAEHESIGRLAAQLHVDQLVVVGEGAQPMHLVATQQPSWGGESVFVADPAAATAFLRGAVRPGDVVLVKASRAVGLEGVALALLDDTTEAER